jgi:hypothetical protein
VFDALLGFQQQRRGERFLESADKPFRFGPALVRK